MILKLINTVTKQEYIYEVEDRKKSNIYFNFQFELNDDMAEGEYNYYVYEEENILAQGLLRYGDYKTENKAYNNTNDEFVQYRG